MEISKILSIVEEKGYLFVEDFYDPGTILRLKMEINSLPLEAGNHVDYPINKGQINEVQQYHHRYYCQKDEGAPVASQLCHGLSIGFHFDLPGWMLNEIGYQRYYAPNDWISPHRDRASDKLLSVTVTISGSAWINIYESKTDPPDYSKLTKIDSYLTKPGTFMFLRAPGLGSGKQIIHEVMSPITPTRDILNLRMRPTILKDPQHTKWR